MLMPFFKEEVLHHRRTIATSTLSIGNFASETSTFFLLQIMEKILGLMRGVGTHSNRSRYLPRIGQHTD